MSHVRPRFSSVVSVAGLATTLLGLAGCVVGTTGTMTPGTYGPYEYETDRPGADYRSFDLPEARPDLCLTACNNEAQCVTFTYVKPGIQGPAPRCLLKSDVPQPVPNACCVSGVVRAPGTPPPPDYGQQQQQQQQMPPPPPPPPPGGDQAFEGDTDRAGSDYRSFDLQEPRPELCRDTCVNEGQCRAFTYVKPGVQGAWPRCWLKSAVPNPTPNGCCVSGVVR